MSSFQLGHRLEDPTVHRLRNSCTDHPSKFQLNPTVETPGNIRLVQQILDLFSARKRIRPEFIFFMNGLSDVLFEGNFLIISVIRPRVRDREGRIIIKRTSSSVGCTGRALRCFIKASIDLVTNSDLCRHRRAVTFSS